MSQASNRFWVTIAAVVGICILQGCALTECLEYREQVVTRQVCDRYSDTGWCASSHTETGTKSVCVKRAEPGAKVENQVDPRAFNARMNSLRKHFPPRDFKSCIALEGKWYGECLDKRDDKCVKATTLAGRCASHIIPDARDSSSCRAAGGWLSQPCERYNPTVAGSCVRPAAYGTCRQPLAFEDFTEIAKLIELDASGEISNPEFFRGGTTRAEFERELAAYASIPSPTNHASCIARKGKWYGVCARSEGDRCLEASRSQGLCRSFIDSEGMSSAHECSRVRGRYTRGCRAYHTGADGKDVCVIWADYGVCVDHYPRPNDLSSQTEKVYLLDSDGAIVVDSGQALWSTLQFEHMRFNAGQ